MLEMLGAFKTQSYIFNLNINNKTGTFEMEQELGVLKVVERRGQLAPLTGVWSQKTD